MRSQFDYSRPTSPQEAVAMRANLGDGARFWAGGTDMTLMWQREEVSLDHCIDLTYLDELRFMDVADDRIRIGAMATLAALERSADRHAHLKTLSDITKLMCTPQTRSIATVGGNLCNASPAADLSPAFVALDAEAVILRPDGERRIAMEDFFEGVNHTVVSNGDLLSEIDIPLPSDHRVGASYRRIDRTVVDIALVNASVSVSVDAASRVAGTRIALGAVAPVIIRSSAAEAVLIGADLNGIDGGLLVKAGELAAADARPISDVRASADYRRAMIKVMVKRALNDAITKLGGTVT
ncbi:MAG: xanthine dehydrogenase family protein subunit M [Pseudomonadota bacterium]